MAKIKWYIAYDKIAKALIGLYEQCQYERLAAGEILYEKCSNHHDFRKNNSWFNKFSSEFGVKSLDPIHVFASFNSNKSPYKNRQIRINILFDLLEKNPIKEEIDFDGCPAPNIIRLQSVRDTMSQMQIWDLFYRAYKEGNNGLNQMDFEYFKDWYGIEFSALTIFLFWIRSDNFLPIDKNTRTFLVSSNILNNVPNNYLTYIDAFKLIDACNNGNNEIYGIKGLFREITELSYQVISLGSADVVYSIEFSNLLSTLHENRKEEKQTIPTNLFSTHKEQIKTVAQSTNLGFRIVAIKPIKGCDKQLLKILKKDQIYYFESVFTIKDDIVEFDEDTFINLYDKPQINTVSLNVTAIVGKNGSGKSSLTELLFMIINNVSGKFRKQLNTNDFDRIKNLHVELYYILNGNLYCLIVSDGKIKIKRYTYSDSKFSLLSKERNFTFQDFDKLFYTIVVNYSHYALNSKDNKEWIEKIFMKNDAYQTPLVINPMRIKGNFDINRENELVVSRLMSLLFMPVESDFDIGIRQLTETQKAVEVELKLKINNKKVLFERIKKEGENEKIYLKDLKTPEDVILQKIAIIFNAPELLFPSSHSSEEEAKKYIISKLIKISIEYPHYNRFFNQETVEFNIPVLDEYIKLIKSDNSHISFKIKQGINFFKHSNLLPRSESINININSYSEYLSAIMSTEQQSNNIMEFLPPPIFQASIILTNKENEKSYFDDLSSGEKQLIHSVSSILYHIINIDSINTKQGNLIGYNNVHLLLDEIELYYHPDLQRRYLDYLLRMIGKLSLDKIEAINICLVTHSPYILSDIHNTNILRLDNGRRREFKSEQLTFGANIHDLLANDFFMEKGFMGEYAKSKIQSAILFLENQMNENANTELTSPFQWSKEEVKKFIDQIGEPLIKDSLKELYYNAFLQQERSIDEEIEYLQKLKSKNKKK